MDHYKSITNMETFFSEDEWMKLSPFIREDEFTDDNFALTGYESEEERSEICKQLLTNAQKELKTLSQPSLEFSMTMANILAIPEFEKIKNQFELHKTPPYCPLLSSKIYKRGKQTMAQLNYIVDL